MSQSQRTPARRNKSDNIKSDTRLRERGCVPSIKGKDSSWKHKLMYHENSLIEIFVLFQIFVKRIFE